MLARFAVGAFIGICLLNVSIGGEAKSDDFKKIQGNWRIVSFEMPGKKMPAGELEKARLKITKDEFIITLGGRTETVRYRLDPSKTPKHFDFLREDDEETKDKRGPERARIAGIYELDGDNLKLCWAGEKRASRPGKDKDKGKDKDAPSKTTEAGGVPRPTQFKVTDDYAVMILKPEK